MSVLAKYQNYGAYYDMRYLQYFTRFKFIRGLSRYNEDDTAFDREGMIKVMGKDCQSYPALDLEAQKTAVTPSERDDECANDSPCYCSLGQMARYIAKNNPFEKVVDEFLLNTYDSIDEQEFQVCKTVIWTMWDISTPYYLEVVARILNSSNEKQSKIFSNILEIEETIQRLISKRILSQNVDYIHSIDKNGNTRHTYEKPHIVLSFIHEPDEAFKAISETFAQILNSFYLPHTDHD
jgi:hypothetical protein